MLKTLKILTLSAIVGLSGMTLAPMAAQAGGGEGGVYLRFGDRDGGRFGLQFGESGRPHRDWDRDRGWDRATCSPGEAVRKASRMGLRNARVVDTSRRSITVRGRMGGEREFITFGRSGRCPVIG
jgi:hypothetical protein